MPTPHILIMNPCEAGRRVIGHFYDLEAATHHLISRGYDVFMAEEDAQHPGHWDLAATKRGWIDTFSLTPVEA